MTKRVPFLLITAVGLGLLIGCDATGDSAATNSTPEAQQPDKVVIKSESFTEAHLQFKPASISPKNTFSIVLPGESADQGETRIVHEKVEDGKHDLSARFNSVDPTSVSVECRNENTGSTQKMAQLTPGELKSRGDSSSVASTRDWPSSFHYYSTNEFTFYSVDYGGKNPGTIVDFPNADEPMECTHVSFKLEDVDSSFAVNGILFEGIRDKPNFQYRQFE